ncbi:MAG: cbb3-type cytochrome c oxidase N-terminal domain-containing protein [Bdellovibrionota bacterium]
MTNKAESNDISQKPLPHNYDGIEELDNPLPRWWLFTFFITIIFAAAYLAYYEVLDGPSSDDYLSDSMTELMNLQEQTNESNNSDETIDKVDEAKLLADPNVLAKGKEHFIAMCAPCHGQLGEGLIGPNLTDKYWLHSKGDFKGVLEAIREGFPLKGMPAWKNMIPNKEQPYLAAFLISIQGSSPPNPKEPQGTEVNTD